MPDAEAQGSDLFWPHLSHLSQLGCFGAASHNTQSPDLPAHLQDPPLPLQALGSPPGGNACGQAQRPTHQASISHAAWATEKPRKWAVSLL